VYGQTPHGLSVELGIAIHEAKAFIDRYFEHYAGVKTWIHGQLESARRTGIVRTLLGRIRRLPELAAKNPNIRHFGERAAVNTVIQGGSADVIKKAMLAIAPELSAKAPGARMLLQVHDELVFEAPKAVVPSLAAWVRSEMEGAVRLGVPLVVDLKTGPNWAEMEVLG